MKNIEKEWNVFQYILTCEYDGLKENKNCQMCDFDVKSCGLTINTIAGGWDNVISAVAYAAARWSIKVRCEWWHALFFGNEIFIDYRRIKANVVRCHITHNVWNDGCPSSIIYTGVCLEILVVISSITSAYFVKLYKYMYKELDFLDEKLYYRKKRNREENEK